MKPETLLMAAIFRGKSSGPNDSDYHESVGGRNLREVLFSLLDKIAERRSHSAPQFSKRIKRLILARYDFDGQPKTLKELGEMFGVTKQYISQQEAIALRMLRHPSRSPQLKRFLR